MFRKTILLFSNFTKQERLIFFGASVLLLASTIFSGWRYYQSHTISVPASGGIYNEGLIGQPALINPISAETEIDQSLVKILFANLLQLTDSYKISPDNKVWTLTLKNDLQWDDGQKLTADDAVFTINAIQDSNIRSPLQADWQEVTAERINENEIRFILKQPYAFFLDVLKELRPIPKHIFADIPITNFRLSNYNLEPVGSGPYKYDGFQKEKNGFITDYQLKVNPNFAGEKSLINEIHFKFFNNTDELISALNNYEVSAAGGLDTKDIEKLKTDFQSFKINIPRYYALFFNLSNVSPLAKEKNLREAVDLAIDKKNINEKVFQNGAVIIDGPVFPTIEGYDQEIFKNNAPDLEKSKKILNGKELTINLIVPKIPFLVDTANVLKENLAKAGITLNLTVAEPEEVLSQYIKTRNYEAILFGNILKANPDVYPFWHSSERFYPGLNLALYNNKEVDKLLESVRKEMDTNKRKNYLSQIQKIIKNDRPAIFLFSPNYFYISDKNLQGFKTNFLASASDRFIEINKWYLKTRRKWK